MKWSEEIANELVEAVKKVGFVSVAAGMCGLSYATVKNWLADGAKEDASPDKVAFLAAFTRARTAFGRKLVTTIEVGDSPDAALKALRIMYPQEMTPPEKLHIGADADAAPVKLVILRDENGNGSRNPAGE